MGIKMIAVIDKNGNVIYIGSWPVNVEFPEGAQEGDFDVMLSESGRYVLRSNYKELRGAAYPDLGDQLDALYHAGAFPESMAAEIQAVKEKYPK